MSDGLTLDVARLETSPADALSAWHQTGPAGIRPKV